MRSILPKTLCCLLALTVLVSTGNAVAEPAYFSFIEAYLGLDHDKDSIFCKNIGKRPIENSTLTGNVGFRANLIQWHEVELNVKASHQSCAFNRDKPTYNAHGLELGYLQRFSNEYYFKHITYFLGVDNDFDNQVFCVNQDALSGSHGVRLNIFTSPNHWFQINAKLQYRDCLRSKTTDNYVTGGLVFIYRMDW